MPNKALGLGVAIEILGEKEEENKLCIWEEVP
jgi:hypothetical protein